ncbi:MAG TPA: hypothetical protein ENJ16_04030 [Planctomycetaceae bacterium]|nr:hypothetical protein [Planctomycetaceae bacterium]
MLKDMLKPCSRAIVVIAMTAMTLAAQAPDPDKPNVAEHQIEQSNTERLEVHKSHDVELVEIWKKVDGARVKTWSTTEGGPYEVTGQSSQQTSIRKSDGSDFVEGDEYRFVIKPTDSQGNSTEIEKVSEHSQ